MRKLIDSLVIINSVFIVGLLAGGTGLYFYAKNPTNQAKAKTYLTKEITKLIPVPEIPKLPTSTGPALPF
tara:strand:+ start:143 stop:352 length:210 start_codon:yes stop_codon:yes gene_type:complete